LELPQVAVATQLPLEDCSLAPLVSRTDSDQGCSSLETMLLQTAMQRNASSEPVELEPSFGKAPFSALAVWNRKPLLMVHVHKAGGTYMCKMARVVGMRIPPTACNWEEPDGYRMSCKGGPFPTCAERAAEYHASGWTAGAIERELYDSDICPNDFRYSVLLRDPIRLIQSNLNFNYNGYHGPPADESMEILKAELAGRGVGSEDDKTGQCGHWKYMDNFQVRILAGATSVPAGKLTTAHLETARARLSKFVAVEKLENMANPSRRSAFFGKLGWLVDAAEHEQEEKEQVSRKVMQFSEVQVSFLRKLNALDYELYHSF